MLRFLSYATLVCHLATRMQLSNAASNQTNSGCAENAEFACGDGTCISNKSRCDGTHHCSDGSDESDCEIFHCSEPNWFRCKNGHCISHAFVCDFSDDCGDYSDERNCTMKSGEAVTTIEICSSDEWKCADRLCIPKEWVCNGEDDCLDGSDETKGCDEKFPCAGFACKNGHCIPTEFRCDQTRDCIDGSDEENCESTIPGCNSTEEIFHCFNNKSCIKESQVCDGIVQCSDSSDETGSCAASNVSCHDLGCSQDCVTLPHGSRCVCKEGYSLQNVVNCTDVDECTVYGVCDQKCENSIGSYNCFCEQKYKLQSDGRSCKAEGGEALMVFSLKTQIRGYLLNSEIYYPIVKRLQQVIGVAYDRNYVYWTQIFAGNESIIKSSQDGTRLQPVVTSGLGTPEDLAIDWITGNIYFTDTEMQHIAVCTNDGMYCSIVVKRGVDKPRSIVLNPLDGEMYWSDWGKRPEIARASMDGTNDIAFVANEIAWPNGLALDRPNGRLYWTDAKLKTIESIKLDGSARRIIFQGIVQHPYGLAVFEDKIYWSDWSTRTIESCNKFTGKDHHILLKHSQEVYGIHIFHSSLQPRSKNPCELTFCSHICLLNERGYSCACPKDMYLDADRNTCRDAFVKQKLVIGTKENLWLLQYEELGNHNTTEILTSFHNVTAMAYNDLNNTLVISDGTSKSLVEMKLPNEEVTTLPISRTPGHVTAMAFDNLGNNLYWCDSEKATVEVLDLNTYFEKVLLGDMEGEIPIGIALVPEEGTMFVAFQTSKLNVHIDRFNMDGQDRRHAIENGLVGPLRLLYDYQLHRIFWSDASAATIQSTSADGDDRHNFRSLKDSPTAIASIKNKLLWANSKSELFWASKLGGDDQDRRLPAEIPTNVSIIHMISVTPTRVKMHPCKLNNGNCSHICLVNFDSPICQCPLGMNLGKDRKTCYKPSHCGLNEFLCPKSDKCIPDYMRCDRSNDCIFGEDEDQCEDSAGLKRCKDGEFQCRTGECIEKSLVCDKYSDCKDNSDEYNCNFPSEKSNQTDCGPNGCGNKHCEGGHCNKQWSCSPEQFKCNSGQCIPKHWECDHDPDCSDTSDEHENCDYMVCPSNRFQCRNGLCIDRELTCNKADDCGDSSDETSCTTTNNVVECKENEFKCYNSNLECLPFSVRCNGSSECPHHEDEQGCSDCHSDEFECANKKCISRHQVCDHKDDCGDNSDEHIDFCSHLKCNDKEFLCVKSNLQCLPISVRCNGTSECPHHEDEQGCSSCHINEFECDNKKCIPRHWVCNRIKECEDNSDEDLKLCSHHQCQDYEFQCTKSDFRCLPIFARCNGTSECPHHEDEQGCSFCHIHEYECRNKKCIPLEWVCDNSDDCGDDSDESLDFCSHKITSPLIGHDDNFVCDQDFRCKNGRCISMDLVCDGINHCGDDSDEHGACSESCSFNNNPCSQVCNKTPSGPQCSCGLGYKLRGDGHTCSDVKECSLEPPACSQICTEQLGSFTCSCYAGYVLRADKRSCKSIENMPMSIVFATTSEIYQLFPRNNNLEILYTNSELEITGIDASIRDGSIYFITKSSGTLNRIRTHDYVRERMDNLGNLQHLTVDWITQNVYFATNSFTSKSIRVCNFETQHCATVINNNINSKVTALTVDAVNRYLFYSVSSWKTPNSPSIIYMCRLDGSDLHVIYHSVNDLVSSLAFDYYKEILYYLDSYNGKISKIQYDGMKKMEILSNLTKPSTLAIYDDHLHFYSLQGYLSACPLFKSYKDCRIDKFYGHFNERYIIFHSSRQPAVRNVCKNSDCLNLCIPKEGKAQCLCNSDTIHNDGYNCQYMQVTKESFKKELVKVQSKMDKGSGSAVTVTLIILVCAAMASLTVYYYCYRKRTGNITISMRFQNPIYGFIQDSSSQEVILQPGQHEYYNPLTAGVDEIQAAKELNKTIVF